MLQLATVAFRAETLTEYSLELMKGTLEPHPPKLHYIVAVGAVEVLAREVDAASLGAYDRQPDDLDLAHPAFQFSLLTLS
jgi:hypothetical protein